MTEILYALIGLCLLLVLFLFKPWADSVKKVVKPEPVKDPLTELLDGYKSRVVRTGPNSVIALPKNQSFAVAPPTASELDKLGLVVKTSTYKKGEK